MLEHHGNGEHPDLQERRRQLLLWRSLGLLIVIGGALGVVRLVLDLVDGSPSGSLVYQAILLLVDGLLGIIVLARLRSLGHR